MYRESVTYYWENGARSGYMGGGQGGRADSDWHGNNMSLRVWRQGNEKANNNGVDCKTTRPQARPATQPENNTTTMATAPDHVG